MDADFQEGSWKPAAKATLAYRIWMPKRCRALLVVIHGFGEHGGRYLSFAAALADQGLCVAIADLYGHGRSSGSRGDIADVHTCVNDLRRLVEEHLLPMSDQTRYFLFGHSFGGMVAIRWAMDRPQGLQGLIVQSPLLKLAFQIPTWKESLATFLGRIWPTFSLPMDLDASSLSHNATVVRDYKNDPAVHNRMSCRCYQSILRTRDSILASAESVQAPTLLLLGQADKIVSTDAAHDWFNRLACRKQMVVFPEAYHELHHESIHSRVLEETLAWVESA